MLCAAAAANNAKTAEGPAGGAKCAGTLAVGLGPVVSRA